MADKKSILEEALLDIKNIESALNANTKEILRSVAKEEIDGVVKESLTKEVYEEEDLDSTEDQGIDLGGDANAASADIETIGMEDEPESGISSLEDLEGSTEVEPEMAPEIGMNADALGGDEIDMTAASDDDVIAIYKKMSGEDEIEIVGDDIHLTVSEPGEYIVKGGASEMGASGLGSEMGDDDVDYEIEMDDEEIGSDEPADLVPVDDEGGEAEEMGAEETGDTDSEIGAEPDTDDESGEEEEETIDEKISVGIGMSVGNHRNPTTAGSIGAQSNPKELNESRKLVSETKKKYNTILTEAKKLKVENDEFRAALKEFRTKLVETVVFNSNLSYATRLFMEHATTKSEKQNIMRRFDEEVSNLKESKKLYKTIGNELESRKPINESIENKIIKEVSTGSSKQLNESTAYVDPSTKRILDLIQRVENK